LREATKDIQNTIVLSGLKLKENGPTTGEFDFIIISSEPKSIIHIEAKNGNNAKHREHADKQLNRGRDFFLKNCPFPSSENWHYSKMMCFGQSVETDICDDCKPFVLSATFFEKDETQSVAKPIANQFKSFWESCKVHKGINDFLIHCSLVSI
jgi:hypothetical protein